MENEIRELSAEDADLLELGVTLGHNQAFSLVAGRCSAAQAQSLRQLREERKYLKVSPTWKDFGPRYLGMSSSQADRIIAMLDEFGPGYFELAQLTRISADTYRAVEPVVKDHALHFNGEVITLDPENARKVAAAVAELRREAAVNPPRPEKQPEERILDIDKRFDRIIADIAHLARQNGDNWPLCAHSIIRMGSELGRLIEENRR
jgi:hypothetical protein